MGRYIKAVILAFLIMSSSWSAAAEAEMRQNIPGFPGTFEPEPGSWSEYSIRDKATGKREDLRISIVGVEGDSYWYEVVNREDGERNVIKLLVKGDPNDPENIQRYIVKSGMNHALEQERDSVLRSRWAVNPLLAAYGKTPADPASSLQHVITGEGVVTVPAGTFHVDLHQIVDATGKVRSEYKSSRDVHPYGVVSAEDENTTIFLEKHGYGAISLITEEPLIMQQPGGMTDEIPGLGPGPGGDIRQIPGMGRGYEPRQLP